MTSLKGGKVWIKAEGALVNTDFLTAMYVTGSEKDGFAITADRFKGEHTGWGAGLIIKRGFRTEADAQVYLDRLAPSLNANASRCES